MKTKLITTLVILAIGFSLNAQNVAISEDNSTPDPSAMLDVQSTDKGMLIPRMTLSERISITNPAEGLTVYQTNDVKGFYYYDGNQWTAFINTSQITDFGSGQVITDTERSLVNSAVQAETDPVFTAHPANGVADAGSGQIITNTERGLVNTALQSESDPVFTAHPANSITHAGSGEVIKITERDSLKTALQEEVDPIYSSEITNAGSGKVITTTERDSLKTALQEEVDPTFNAHVASDISDAGSGSVITDTERTKLSTIQENADRTPPGTISAFGGDTPPDGYLLCDGSSKYIADYPGLHSAIGTNWGGDGTTTFNVPDLRGYFLRGMDIDNGNGLANNDPDIADRTDINGNTVGNVVGSYQDDEFENHNHVSFSGADVSFGSGATTNSVNGNNSAQPIDYTGGNETRPKNAYVNYIIKY